MSNEGANLPLEPGVLSAAQMLEWRAKGRPSLPAAAVLTNQGWLLSRRLPFRRRPVSPFSFDYEMAGEGVALVACRGVGAPGAAIAIEEMAVSGVKRLIALNIGGSIDGGMKSGDVMLVRAALTGDGTSKHYTDGAKVEASGALFDALAASLGRSGIGHHTGTVWSTDAVYRETEALLTEARQQGAAMVDMETAAILAAAAALGIEAAAVLVAADQITDRWQPPEDMEAVKAQVRRLLPVIVAGLKR